MSATESSEVERLKADLNAAAEALDDASILLAVWADYASDYFKEKHNLPADIAGMKLAAAKARVRAQ